MNSQQLNSQGQNLQARAASNRKQAERFSYNAQTYRENGDVTRAEVDEQCAQQLIADAEGYESEAEQSFETSLGLDARAQQLESEKQQVQSEYESKIAEIEKKKSELTGGGTGFF